MEVQPARNNKKMPLKGTGKWHRRKPVPFQYLLEKRVGGKPQA
jgi:hypothetical protein